MLTLKYVPPTISITYIFSVSLKFRVCYTTGQWGEFIVKNANSYLHILSWYFFAVFHKKMCFYHFHFFFWWSIKFPQEYINQSEIEIGDTKLSEELYEELQLSCRNFTRLFVRQSPPKCRAEFSQFFVVCILLTISL